MFNDKEKFSIKKEKYNNNFSVLPTQEEKHSLNFLSFFRDNAGIAAAVVFVLILALGIFSYFIFIKKDIKDINVNQPKMPAGQNILDDPAGILPNILSGNGNGAAGGDDIPEDLKAEDVLFGFFYKKPMEDYGYSESLLFGLPINVKTDVSNYYYISRKINLDSQIKQLNQEGFAILDNPFSGKNKKIKTGGQADNFYSMYKLLREKEIPFLITSDFLIYYYQNVFKQAYKDIEKDVFYSDLWQINKRFYEISNNKYRELRKRSGMVNNAVLEGRRLETAYFATALELLKPKQDQISQELNDSKFSAVEAEKFEFNLPDYLEDDIKREIDFIIAAKEKNKSPVFLYSRDYEEFKIPKSYEKSAKLSNFYLAAKWMNSVFPLYHRNEGCADCLLDKDDWTINMIAACMITQDFFNNQDLKNQWAKIYKVISFFSGLRSGLTYLHYQGALIDLFGNDYQADSIFSSDNPNSEENFLKLREKIAKYEFSNIEGGINRKDPLNAPFLGMRMLQQSYWPDDYIFSRLTNPITGPYLSDVKDFEKEINLTDCEQDRPSERCGGFGLDIINLIYPIGDGNIYFQENTNYQGYAGQIDYLRNQLGYFNLDSWHNNNFWATLSIVKSFLGAGGHNNIYASDNWQNKNINSSLAAWVNLRLPADELLSGWQEQDGNLGLTKVNSNYDYIEPDIKLVNELIANSKMLLDALLALEVAGDADSTYNRLNKLIDELEKMKGIIKKELNGEILDYTDLEIINNFARQFVVAESGNKNIELELQNSKRFITESIEGMKLLILVYNYDDKKVFAVGPIFNYQER